MIENAHDGVNRPGFGIVCSINESSDAGVNHGAGAHRARFNRHEEIAVEQAMIAECEASLAQGDDFSMRGWIVIGEVAIEAATNDVSFMHNDRANWNFAEFERALGGAQSFAHPEFVRFVSVRHEKVL